MGAAPARPGGVAGLLNLFRESGVLLQQSSRLRRSLLAWLATGLVFTQACCLGIALLHGDGVVWIAGAGLAWWAFITVFLVGGAALLVRPDGTRVDYYGVPNGLSAIRAWACLPLLLAALLSLPGNLNFVLWCSFGATTASLDFVDGYLARRFGPVTEMGQAFDPAMDALFFSMAAVGSVYVNIFPAWLAAVTLVRYIGPLVATPIVFLMKRRPQLVHTEWGRRNTAIMGGVFFILMCSRIFNGPSELLALIAGVGGVVPTMLLHFWSLFDRARKAPVVA